MTLTHRRLIYSVFILAFVISAPILVLYTSGYRYNPKKKSVQKTGIIFIETKPKQADVFLNNNFINSATPLQIKNLLPNDYELSIARTGYIPWSKKITVYPGITTPLQYIRLFRKNNLPNLLVSGEIVTAVANKTQSALAFVQAIDQSLEISVLNLSTGIIRPVYVYSGDPIDKIEYLDDNRLAVYLLDKILIINPFDFSPGRITNLSALAKITPVNRVKMISSAYFYYLKNNQLRDHDLLTGSDRLILDSPVPIIDYLPKNNYIYYLTNDSLNKTNLKKYNLSDKSDHNVYPLDRSDRYEIKTGPDNFILIHNPLKRQFVLIDETNHNMELIQPADYWRWNNHNELLFGNDSEIWSYRPAEAAEQYILFTRSSQPISEVSWYPFSTHIFYVVRAENKDQLKIMENLISNRSSADIIALDQIKNVIPDKKGEKIYFIGQCGHQSGLYELDIQ